MLEEIVIAGFGGQGVMVAGQLLVHAGMEEGKQVAWIPSYGPEMRGGTANCTVIISDEEVGSPIVLNPGIAIVMNRPSLDKYEPLVRPGGLLIYNSSLITRRPERSDLKVVAVPANDEAVALGNARLANTLLLGALLGLTDMLPLDAVAASMPEVFGPRHQDLLALNRRALERGRELALAPAGSAG
ncbi:MAG: 2-oxoacid:acceptor oxidoreductase family protein [Chloroflexi bacterium]|nr:2-oxoacid:acceptor oxidoreductase family protein [Chloroflexota bacterium]